ncbi:hypothetical protein AMTRI_Chr04g179710 [Amborella trichopoda]
MAALLLHCLYKVRQGTVHSPLLMRCKSSILIISVLFFHGVVVVWGQAQAQAQAPMDWTEKEALYSLIQGLLGEEWNGSHLYPDPCGWTPIQGVSCDLLTTQQQQQQQLWYVTSLSIGPIHENSLRCHPTAPHLRTRALSRLAHLRSLSIFSCFFSLKQSSPPLVLPTSAADWPPNLEFLQFRHNPSLNGPIPVVLGSLTKLRSLVLEDNSLTGPIPAGLGDHLPALQRLVLSGNALTGAIPTSLSQCKQLLILDLSFNNLSLLGDPTSLPGSLLKLDLSHNLLDTPLLEFNLGVLSSLTLLDMRGNRITGGLPASLSGMQSVREMMLGNNPIEGLLDMVPWGEFQELETLDLSNSGYTGDIPESLFRLKKLRFLGLQNNSLTGGVPGKLLVEMPSMSRLYLNGNNLSGPLELPVAFYKRMGGSFVIWDNPGLCYYPPPLPINNNIQLIMQPLGLKCCPVSPAQTLPDASSSSSSYAYGLGNASSSSSYDMSSSCSGITSLLQQLQLLMVTSTALLILLGGTMDIVRAGCRIL